MISIAELVKRVNSLMKSQSVTILRDTVICKSKVGDKNMVTTFQVKDLARFGYIRDNRDLPEVIDYIQDRIDKDCTMQLFVSEYMKRNTGYVLTYDDRTLYVIKNNVHLYTLSVFSIYKKIKDTSIDEVVESMVKNIYI